MTLRPACLAIVLAACGNSAVVDSGVDGSLAIDAGVSDAGVSDAGPTDGGGTDGGARELDASRDVDAGPREVDAGLLDAGVLAYDVLTSETGCFFTPSASEPARVFRAGVVGTIYRRLELTFDVVAGPYQPHVPDPSNRTEHILFGLSRANQPRSFQRYLMGAAAVTFMSRGPHYRMFGRDEIAEGFMSYDSDSGAYRWTEGTRYTLACFLDADLHQQECDLVVGGSVAATRTIAVDYLDAATHMSTAFDLVLGTDNIGDIEVSPLGWNYCDFEVRGYR